MSDKWPIRLLLPSAKDFGHNHWMRDGGNLDSRVKDVHRTGDLAKSRALGNEIADRVKYECDTQCCLVGWMGLAFRGPWMPSQIRYGDKLSKPHREFMIALSEKVIEDRGLHSFPSTMSDLKLMNTVSDMFEGEDGRGGLTARWAEALWIETARDFGYDC